MKSCAPWLRYSEATVKFRCGVHALEKSTAHTPRKRISTFGKDKTVLGDNEEARPESTQKKARQEKKIAVPKPRTDSVISHLIRTTSEDADGAVSFCQFEALVKSSPLEPKRQSAVTTFAVTAAVAENRRQSAKILASDAFAFISFALCSEKAAWTRLGHPPKPRGRGAVERECGGFRSSNRFYSC